MIWKILRLSYGMKNYQNHMGVRKIVTIRGMMRRLTRKYPKTYNYMKKTFLIGGFSCILLYFIPNSSLPVQKQVKLTFINMWRYFACLQNYNWFIQDRQQYLISLNQLLLFALNNSIFDAQLIISYFKQIEEVVQSQRKQISYQGYLNLLLYAEIMLQLIIRFQKKLLLSAEVIHYYNWIFNNLLINATDKQLNCIQSKHLQLFYVVVNYILNYSPNDDRIRMFKLYLDSFSVSFQNTDKMLILSKTQKQIKNKQSANDIKLKILQNGLKDKQFINMLKKIYSQNKLQQNKQIILDVFELLNKTHNYIESDNNSL